MNCSMLVNSKDTNVELHTRYNYRPKHSWSACISCHHQYLYWWVHLRYLERTYKQLPDNSWDRWGTAWFHRWWGCWLGCYRSASRSRIDPGGAGHPPNIRCGSSPNICPSAYVRTRPTWSRWRTLPGRKRKRIRSRNIPVCFLVSK